MINPCELVVNYSHVIIIQNCGFVCGRRWIRCLEHVFETSLRSIFDNNILVGLLLEQLLLF